MTFTPEITAAITAYENAATLSARITAFCACEAIKNRAALNHRIDESDAIHLEMVRIGKDTRVVDAMDAAAKAARNNLPATQEQAA